MIKKLCITLLLLFTVPTIMTVEVHAAEIESPFIFYEDIYAVSDDSKNVYRAIAFFVPVDTAPSTLYLYIPDINNFFVDDVTIDGELRQSRVVFYVDSDTPDYTTFIIKDSYDINTDSMSIMSDITLMSIILYFEFPYYVNTGPESTFIDWFNENFEYTFDTEPTALDGDYHVKFYNGLNLWYETYYDTIPVEPWEPVRSVYQFNSWETISGEKYDFDDSLLEPDYDETFTDIYHLYANFQRSVPITPDEIDDDFNPADVTDTNDTRLTTFLTSFGLYNYPGFMVIFAALALLITGLLLYLRMPSFVILTMNILLAATWIFLGWFPFYVTILVMIALVSGVFVSYKRSGGGEIS
jgi:hypothetical protein